MSDTRIEKIWGDVVTRKSQTALVTISIFIGVLAVVTLFSMSDILIDTLESTLQEDRLAMIKAFVTLKSSEVTPGGEADLNPLRALPDVEHFQAMTIASAFWREPGAEAFNEARVLGYDQPMESLPLEPVELVAGAWPQPGQREIAVERRFASTHGLRPGDTLELRILGDGTTPGEVRVETWTIAGTLFQPYQYPIVPGAPSYIPGKEMIFAAGDDVHALSGRGYHNILLLRYADFALVEARARDVEAVIAEQTPFATYVTLTEDPAHNSLTEPTRILSSVTNMLAIVALIVAGFLVLNIINAMVIEQRRHIGVMKALGATGWDTFLMYAGIAFIYGVIGTVPAVLLGIPFGYQTAQGVAQEINIFLEDFTISPTAVLVGALLGVLVPVLAAVVPVLLGIRVTILEAITDLGIRATYGGGILARLADALPLPVSLGQSLRNLVRKKGRLALTVVTLSLAAGAFMGVYSTLSSFDVMVARVMDQIGIDIIINPGSPEDFEAARALLAENVAGMKAIEPGTTLAIAIDGYTPAAMGVGPSFMIASGINPSNPDLVNFRLRSGRAWRDDPGLDGVVVSATIAEGLDRQAGDEVTIRVGNRAETFEILGVADYTFDTVWMPWQDLSRLGGLTRGAPVPNEYFTTVRVDDQATVASGINTSARPFLTFTEGDFFTPGEPGVIISAALAEARGYAVGDTLAVSSGDRSAQLPVTGIFTPPPQLAQPGQPDEAIALFWEDLAALEGLPLDGEPIPSTLQIVLDDDDATAAETDAVIDQMDALLLDHGIQATFSNWVQVTEETLQTIDIARAIFNTATAMLGAVGAIGLLSALSMSVFERQKEIGVMRTVGATSGRIAGLFLVEGLLVGAIAWVIGIPLSYGLNRSLIRAFNFENMAGAGYPAETLPLGVIVMLLMAAGASLWPSLAAARKTVSDILRYQ